MREYKPFLNWEEVRRSGLLDELLPEREEVEIFVPDGNKKFVPLE